MCGIVGYVGSREAIDYLLGGLRRLEYRGYDSAGVATITADGKLTLCKSAGRIDRLEACLAEMPVAGQTGIGHTRWATHGRRATKTPTPISVVTANWQSFTTA